MSYLSELFFHRFETFRNIIFILINSDTNHFYNVVIYLKKISRIRTNEKKTTHMKQLAMAPTFYFITNVAYTNIPVLDYGKFVVPSHVRSHVACGSGKSRCSWCGWLVEIILLFVTIVRQ